MYRYATEAEVSHNEATGCYRLVLFHIFRQTTQVRL